MVLTEQINSRHRLHASRHHGPPQLTMRIMFSRIVNSLLLQRCYRYRKWMWTSTRAHP